MAGSVLIGVRIRHWAALCLGLLACIFTQAVSAAGCPGHPDAIGTSRTLVVDPLQHPRIGTMQYPETLPLEDHEVVLTFDDGPLPRYSNQILEILAAQCVKATFFTVGRMAQSSPEGVRKLRDAGHTIGTHTQNHPLRMNKMPIERAKQEIDDGIASVKAALGGDDAALAPFLRIPGLARATAVEDYLASEGIQVWSADFPADDWRHVSSQRVYDLAIKRLEDKGRGILLLHDIHERTVAALPRILSELKARGYRIVHVVPATAERPATPTEPQQWQLHPPSEAIAISHWPKIPNFVFADAETLPAPSWSDLDWRDGQSMTLSEPVERVKVVAHSVPLPREAPWPRQFSLPPEDAVNALPVPAESNFGIPEKSYAAIAPASPRPTARETNRNARVAEADSGEPRRTMSRKHFGHGRRAGVSHMAGRRNEPAAHASRRDLKHLVLVKKRHV